MMGTATMQTTTSADGTTIAYERHGEGSPLVLLGGAFNDRGTVRDLALGLATDFSVYVYDRRGRGDSGDTPPYAVEREVEDLEAVIHAAGGTAGVFGHSSGAALAVHAAAAGAPVSKLAVYEPPYRTDVPATLREHVVAAVAAGDRIEAIRLFLTQAVGIPKPVVPMIQASPDWAGMSAIAHTLPYDLAVLDDGVVPESAATIRVPTLALLGGASPEWFATAVAKFVAAVPGARSITIAGEDHAILQRPAALVPALIEFFS